jgi:hypothetical protein
MLLADRMLTLAQQADGAGLGETARRLLALAFDVFDEQAVSYRRDQTVLRLVPPSLPTSSAAAIAL